MFFASWFSAFAVPVVDDPSGFEAPSETSAIGALEEQLPEGYVVGGAPSAFGSWQSTVALLSNGQLSCTGTLVADDVVITAAHCVLPNAPTHVRTGSVDGTSGGQLIPVSSATPHWSYNDWGGVDIAVLQLQSPSSSPTTTIATDCIADEAVVDGGTVMIVGFGSTNPAGTVYPDTQYEASSTIRDADCSQDFLSGVATTCDWALRPAGELVAGGNGIDSCYGDSGGPLYVSGDDGQWYVAGVTSRGVATSQCGDGGVYVRPDTHIQWIENQVGALPRPNCNPLPTPPPTPPTIPTPPPTPPTEPPIEETDEEEPEQPPSPPTDAPTEEKLAPLSPPTLFLAKNTMGALELTEHGIDDQWVLKVTHPGHAAASYVEAGTLFYRPRMGWVGGDVVEVQVTDPNGVTELHSFPVLVTSGGGCDQSGGSPAGLLLLILPLLVRRR